MGRFDRVLITSDVDGTFDFSPSDAVAINSEAIRLFTREGGRFAFSTGRDRTHLDKMGFTPLINAPVCLYNGAIVYDVKEERPLFVTKLPYTVAEAAELLKGAWEGVSFINVHLYENGEETQYKLYEGEGEDDTRYPLKLVAVFESESCAIAFKKRLLLDPAMKSVYVSRSWTTGVELTSIGATKGTAVRFIRDALGDSRLIVAVGDYENDVEMLRAADIPVAVGNACDMLKNHAQIVTRHARDGALADLVDRLGKMAEEGKI